MKTVFFIATIVALVSFVSSEDSKKPSVEVKQVCIPKQSFRLDCNSCMCDDNGQPGACTLVACVDSVKCEDGTMKREGCDTCVCRGNVWYCYTSGCRCPSRKNSPNCN